MDSPDYPITKWIAPNFTVLEQYRKYSVKEALRLRKLYSENVSRVEEVFSGILDEFQDLSKMLVHLRSLQEPVTTTLESENVPDTEGSHEIGGDNSQETVTLRFLCKKAYRAAAALTHPDKGGTSEEFALVNAAYKDLDLASLTNFLIQKSSEITIPTSHWLTEIQKSHAAWLEYTSTIKYKIVSLRLTGNVGLSSYVCRQLLEQTIQQLLARRNLNNTHNKL